LSTENKDFKVKNGLSVGGSGIFSGTVEVATPTENSHAATKLYVDQNAGGGVTVSTTPPESPSEGDGWYNSSNGGSYIYYDGFWVETSSGAESSTISANSPIYYSQESGELGIDLSFFEDNRIMAIMGAI